MKHNAINFFTKAGNFKDQNTSLQFGPLVPKHEKNMKALGLIMR